MLDFNQTDARRAAALFHKENSRGADSLVGDLLTFKKSKGCGQLKAQIADRTKRQIISFQQHPVKTRIDCENPGVVFCFRIAMGRHCEHIQNSRHMNKLAGSFLLAQTQRQRPFSQRILEETGSRQLALAGLQRDRHSSEPQVRSIQKHGACGNAAA